MQERLSDLTHRYADQVQVTQAQTNFTAVAAATDSADVDDMADATAAAAAVAQGLEDASVSADAGSASAAANETAVGAAVAEADEVVDEAADADAEEAALVPEGAAVDAASDDLLAAPAANASDGSLSNVTGNSSDVVPLVSAVEHTTGTSCAGAGCVAAVLCPKGTTPVRCFAAGPTQGAYIEGGTCFVRGDGAMVTATAECRAANVMVTNTSCPDGFEAVSCNCYSPLGLAACGGAEEWPPVDGACAGSTNATTVGTLPVSTPAPSAPAPLALLRGSPTHADIVRADAPVRWTVCESAPLA